MVSEFQHRAHEDFLISYASPDRIWAEWIVWQLEASGYTTALQAWDVQPSENFVLNMQNANNKVEHIIAVLSPDYLNALYSQPEWAAAFQRDPTGERSILIPVHVRESEDQLRGLLGLVTYIDLVGLDEQGARKRLLAGVSRERRKPKSAPNFQKDIQYSLSEQPRFPGTNPVIWNVPYQRNPFFTGRVDILHHLHDTFTLSKAIALTQPQAISGLGGIGKTQTAIEYAYQYRSDYQTVLWVMADSRETLISDFVSIAHLLNLPDKDAQDQSKVVDSVKRWLSEQVGWLLIFDNVEDLYLVEDFIPAAGKGHVLLTTRVRATGMLAQSLEVEKMGLEEASLFLLRRIKMITSNETLDRVSASDLALVQKIATILDGLPLALDQAGAYIEETGCSLSDYLQIYQSLSSTLLRRRGSFTLGHPEPVATTWSLSFQKVEQSNAASAELLRLCAFLYPHAIPEEIITEDASDFGPTLQSLAANPIEMDIAIAGLLQYSLVRRNRDSKTLTIHRLVQALLRETMSEDEQHQWAERAVRAVNRVFPDVESATWQHRQRYLPQAQTCATLIEEWKMRFPEAARLLNQAGTYLQERAQYAQAEPLFLRALTIYEQMPETDYSNIVNSLNNLSSLYYTQGHYEQAEQTSQRALVIVEESLGPTHLKVAATLNNLAYLYLHEGKYEQAEPLFQRALTIYEQTLGPEHPKVANSLNDLAYLYFNTGKYEQAEPLFQRALTIYEQTLGTGHPNVANSLNDLAYLYFNTGKYEQAEPLFLRALTIYEQILGPEHLEIASSLNNLALLYSNQGKYEQAESLFLRAITVYEQALGPEHLRVARSFNNLAQLYSDQGKYDQAEPLFQRALAIYDKTMGLGYLNSVSLLESYANLLRKKHRESEAVVLEARAAGIKTGYVEKNNHSKELFQ